MKIMIRSEIVLTKKNLHFRKTLKMNKKASIKFVTIRLRFKLNTNAKKTKMKKLINLTKKYCVMLQTNICKSKITVTSSRMKGKN